LSDFSVLIHLLTLRINRNHNEFISQFIVVHSYSVYSMKKPPGPELAKGMIFMVIGNFLMTYVFAHNIAVWNPGISVASMAMSAAFFTWQGFYLPGDLEATVWEKKSWKLFFINTGHHFVSVLVAAIILTHMR
jgi:hypothetical protein